MKFTSIPIVAIHSIFVEILPFWQKWWTDLTDWHCHPYSHMVSVAKKWFTCYENNICFSMWGLYVFHKENSTKTKYSALSSKEGVISDTVWVSEFAWLLICTDLLIDFSISCPWKIIFPRWLQPRFHVSLLHSFFLSLLSLHFLVPFTVIVKRYVWLHQ